MADEVYLTPEERLAQLGDRIMASVIRKDANARTNRAVLFSTFNPKIFRDENYVIFKVFYSFRDRGVTPDEDFLRMYLLRNEKIISDAGEYLDVQAYADLDEDPVTGYVMAVIKQYSRLLTMPVESLENFKLLMEKYRLEFMSSALGDAYSKAKTMLYDGIKQGRDFKMGYNDSVAYIKKTMTDIETSVDSSQGMGIIDASVVGLIDDDQNAPEYLGDFGLINELNKHLGGIYSSYFYSILAPTKGGKSKFTTRMMHNMIINGTPVVVWAHEGGYAAWLAQLRAVHFDWVYNRKEPDITKHKLGVTQEVILRGNYPSEAIRQLEDASRVDLFTNPKYGKVTMVDAAFKVETFLDDIDTAVMQHGAKAVLVDYLQLITSNRVGASKPQIIGEAYQKALAYAKKKNVAFISPAQMTQDFMNEMAKSKEGSSHELRTAGGETSEVIRTPDINIALYGSIEDIRAGSMKILSIPSRLCQPFPEIDIYCDLGICQFASLTADDDA